MEGKGKKTIHPPPPILGYDNINPCMTSPNLREKEFASLQAEHQYTVAQIKKSHAEELKKLGEQIAKEIQGVEEAFNLEKGTKMAELRKVLVSEQVSEEAELKARKSAALNDLSARLKEEEEEEEARLMEEKQDTLRKLRQQVSMVHCVKI